MKKTKKYISLMMATLLSFGLAACSGESEEESVKTNEKIKNDYRVELATFEKGTNDYSLFKLLDDFGKVSRNKNADYVKNGDFSVKLQPIGGMYSGSKPSLYYPFTSEYYNFNYEDFTNVDYVSFWIYNDNEEEKTLRVGLISEVLGVNNVKKLPALPFTLKPKSWNLINYYIDFNAIGITQEVTEEMIKAIKGVYFEFDRAASVEVSEAPVYYVDDINIYYKEEANVLGDATKLLSFNTDEKNGLYEICDFEKPYQKYIFGTDAAKSKIMPLLSVVNADAEGISGFSASSGSSVLKVNMGAGDEPTSWPTLILSKKIMRTFFDQYVYDYDTKTPIIPISEWSKYHLACDIYVVGNENDAEFAITHQFYNGNFSWYSRATSTQRVKPGAWSTWTWSLADISDKANSRWDSSAAVQAAYNEYAADYDKYGAGKRITDAGEWRIVYTEFTGEDKVMYIDNLRLYRE